MISTLLTFQAVVCEFLFSMPVAQVSKYRDGSASYYGASANPYLEQWKIALIYFHF